ncbi:MAG: type 1 glutamine amidotransferase [Candidatus Omnitrophica bacterium]|nr:type 1 glutamine amidotransferase [Candidatus Omnitrophota bacterium]
MRVLIVKNVPEECPGLLEEILTGRHISLDTIDLDRGDVFPDPRKYSAIFVFGGPDSANDVTPKIQDELQKIQEALHAGIPYLGICLGMQLLVKAAGGEVYRNPVKETGWKDPEGKYFSMDLTPEGHADPIFKGLSSPVKTFQLHGETVRLTQKMTLLATGRHCKNQVVKIGDRAYGIQGHPELTHAMLEAWLTEEGDLKSMGADLLRNHYRPIRVEYEKIGKTIFNNFLEQAQIIA